MRRAGRAGVHYRRAAAGFVYFLRSPVNGLIKIGFTTKHPDSRLIDFRTVSPVPVEPMGFHRGRIADEKALHVRFRGSWSHGEWFRETPELASHVAATCGPWDFRPPAEVAPFPRAGRPLTNREWAGRSRRDLPLMTIKAMLNRAVDPGEIFGLAGRPPALVQYGRPLGSR